MKLYGETYKWSKGLEVTIAKPVAFTPREGTYGMEGYKNAVKMNFTVKNSGSSALKPSVFPNVQSGTREGKRLYDSSNGCGSAPYSSLLPGKTLTFTLCYGVDDVNDVQTELNPFYDQSAYWVSKKS